MATKIKRLSAYDSEAQKSFIEAVVAGDAKITRPTAMKGIEKAFLMQDGDDTILILIDLNFSLLEKEMEEQTEFESDDTDDSEN